MGEGQGPACEVRGAEVDDDRETRTAELREDVAVGGVGVNLEAGEVGGDEGEELGEARSAPEHGGVRGEGGAEAVDGEGGRDRRRDLDDAGDPVAEVDRLAEEQVGRGVVGPDEDAEPVIPDERAVEVEPCGDVGVEGLDRYQADQADEVAGDPAGEVGEAIDDRRGEGIGGAASARRGEGGVDHLKSTPHEVAEVGDPGAGPRGIGAVEISRALDSHVAPRALRRSQ